MKDLIYSKSQTLVNLSKRLRTKIGKRSDIECFSKSNISYFEWSRSAPVKELDRSD